MEKMKFVRDLFGLVKDFLILLILGGFIFLVACSHFSLLNYNPKIDQLAVELLKEQKKLFVRLSEENLTTCLYRQNLNFYSTALFNAGYLSAVVSDFSTDFLKSGIENFMAIHKSFSPTGNHKGKCIPNKELTDAYILFKTLDNVIQAQEQLRPKGLQLEVAKVIQALGNLK